ncbi:MAG: GNAT family N-acetyltransferase [Nostoc sp. ZfuVER08]|jgi:RimJ/RimL family protein N-acetyltransferase|uniref:GNAT family N-acetyltransferase n=1 Tax=Nostoc punctiforme FACHB-252 TaxID=1357509 RepID=A0ABR8HBU5_NOSPU|nr:GNAT family protein [Nostoc punctiforme]MBD2613091.1 GNAT family N-acetyltransferase [Nostoc punctiforme FACHB-252]MBL1201057.1 GNAT family N-acetyltransferase [Nostoc sp. GBBB01]MDZ8011641.1 GNAT family protein [Nostoc sp. ZfuVER08]
MIIETNRLLMREFIEADWQAVFTYQSNPLYLLYSHWTHRTQNDVCQFVQMFINQQTEEPRTKFQLAIILKQENILIGNCGIRINNSELRKANIGYEINPHYWGQGYATEAAQTIVKFGFEELKMHHLWSWCVAENIASLRVLEKIGMHRETHLREKELIKGRWYDNFIYAILENEWKTSSMPDINS